MERNQVPKMRWVLLRAVAYLLGFVVVVVVVCLFVLIFIHFERKR